MVLHMIAVILYLTLLAVFTRKIFISKLLEANQIWDTLFLALTAMTKQLWRYYLEKSAENYFDWRVTRAML